MRVLTNITVDKLAAAQQAAAETGFRIIVRDTPQTIDEAMVENDYDREGYTPPSDCGSIWTDEPFERDHGPFWDAFDRRKG